MKIVFFKYQGTGNDFIIIDNRLINNNLLKEKKIIKKLCDRRFGIGSDGLILIENTPKYDFYMKYYNSDGLEGSMCGNAGRCCTIFMKNYFLKEKKIKFKAIDGLHKALILENNNVLLKMNDISKIEKHKDHYFLNTGSPHYVKFTSNIEGINVYNEGKKIRFNKKYFKIGVNVNFLEYKKNILYIRTYERGVENETLSCGTGSVAGAISAYHKGIIKYTKNIKIKTLGGQVIISFNINTNNNEYENIWIKGKAKEVFKGQINI